MFIIKHSVNVFQKQKYFSVQASKRHIPNRRSDELGERCGVGAGGCCKIHEHYLNSDLTQIARVNCYYMNIFTAICVIVFLAEQCNDYYQKASNLLPN